MEELLITPKSLFVEEKELTNDGFALAGVQHSPNRNCQYVKLDDVLARLQQLSNCEAEEMIKLQNDESVAKNTPAVYAHGEVWRAMQFLLSEFNRIKVV